MTKRRHRPTTPETAFYWPFQAKIIPPMSKPELNRLYLFWQQCHQMIEMHTYLPIIQRLQKEGVQMAICIIF